MKSKFILTSLAFALAATPAFAATAAAAPDEAVTRITAERDAREATLKAQVAARQSQAEALKAQAAAGEQQAKARAEADKVRLEMEKIRTREGGVTLRTVANAKLPPEPVTFLGVMTAPAPSSLTTQLGRPAGMGLVVVSVQPKSPAEGVINVDDLLVRLDDQKLINNDQLTALIRARQEGEEVTLTFVRGGKETSAKVKLVKQEVAAGKPTIVTVARISGQPNEEMKYALQGPDEWKIGSSVQGKTTIENGGLNQTFTYTHGNGDRTTEIKIVNGKKTVTTRAGSSIEFTGPYDTEEERKAVPASIQTRVADAESRINAVLQVKPPTKVPATGIQPVGTERIGVRINSESPEKTSR